MQSHQQDLVDYLDTESVQFVNPYDINPILDVNMATMPTNNLPQTFGLQMSISGDYYTETQEDTKPQIKMEEFSDLSDLLLTSPTRPALNDCTDELATPVFEKGPFDLSSYNHQTKVSTANSYKNLESVRNPLYASEENINFNDISDAKNLLGISDSEIHLDQNVFTQKGNFLDLKNTEKKDDKEDVFNFNEFIATSANTEIINIVDDNDQFNINMYTPENTPSYVSSPKETPNISYANSPEEQIYFEEPTDIHTPEDSNSSNYKRNKLTIEIGRVLPKVKVENLSEMCDINTPDVLSQVVDLGEDFNILDLVNNDDLIALEADDELLSTITSPISSAPSTPASVNRIHSKSLSAGNSRRRKSSYYEDEEYLPPNKKKSTVCLRDIDIENDSDSENEYKIKTEVKPKIGKARGRPPKNTHSSEYQGSEVSRYRELRDKNNEASRKSRLKRKMKEQNFETEADDLHVKNIKLKAQVEELEKIVSTYRNNLMHIMIKK